MAGLPSFEGGLWLVVTLLQLLIPALSTPASVYRDTSCSIGRTFIADMIQDGGRPLRRIYDDPSLCCSGKDMRESLAVAVSPMLPTHPKRYRISLKAFRHLRRALASDQEKVDSRPPASLDLAVHMNGILHGCDDFSALSRWIVSAAVKLSGRIWDEEQSVAGRLGVWLNAHDDPGRYGLVAVNSTSAFRLEFEAQQLAWLVGEGRLGARYLEDAQLLHQMALFLETNHQYRSRYTTFLTGTLRDHAPVKLPASHGRSVYSRSLPSYFFAPLTFYLNPNIYLPTSRDQGLPGDRWDIVDSIFQAKDPNFVVVDHVLLPEVLEELQAFFAESTHWWDARHGYIGSYYDYWDHPAIIRLADELQDRMPLTFQNTTLTNAWAYLYDYNDAGNESFGITPHADFACINVNIWLTPEDANEDPMSGGLVVWKEKPPAGWSYHEYNQRPDLIETLTRGASNYTIAYRTNRAVIFDSTLFHRTADYSFPKRSIHKRRINLTLLFGIPKTLEQPIPETPSQSLHDNVNQARGSDQTKKTTRTTPPPEGRAEAEVKSATETTQKIPGNYAGYPAKKRGAADTATWKQKMAESSRRVRVVPETGDLEEVQEMEEAKPQAKMETRVDDGRCRVAVAVSGQWRSFSDSEVRRLFRSHLLDSLAGGSAEAGGAAGEAEQRCELDLFFDAKISDELRQSYNDWFKRSTTQPATRKEVEDVIRNEFGDLTVLLSDLIWPSTVGASASRPRGRSRIIEEDPKQAPGGQH